MTLICSKSPVLPEFGFNGHSSVAVWSFVLFYFVLLFVFVKAE